MSTADKLFNYDQVFLNKTLDEHANELNSMIWKNGKKLNVKPIYAFIYHYGKHE